MRSTNHLPDDPVGRMLDQYTQLPDTLPDRVRDLAQELTKDHDNWFDMAKAIEGYFKKEGFIYDQRNVAIPEKPRLCRSVFIRNESRVLR